MKIAQEKLLKNWKKKETLYHQIAKEREFQEGEKVILLLSTDTSKLLMQWKRPCEIISRCKKGNDYRVEVNKKVKTFYSQMLKKYLERADRDRAPQQNSDDNQVISCNVSTGIIGGNENLSVHDNEMLELANCLSEGNSTEVKLGVELTKTLQEEMNEDLVKTQRDFFGYSR